MPEPGRPLVILGAGGHAKVVVELIRAMDAGFRIVGLLDADPTPRTVAGAPVLGTDALLPELYNQGVRSAFVAIGDNGVRRRAAAAARGQGFELVNAISPRATVSPTARLGAGIAIMAGAVVNAEASLEDLVIVNTGAVVEHDARLGIAAHAGPGSVLAGNVEMEAEAFLGAGACAIPGVRIGAGAQVGAGASVVSDIPAGVLAYGVPARVARSLASEDGR